MVRPNRFLMRMKKFFRKLSARKSRPSEVPPVGRALAGAMFLPRPSQALVELRATLDRQPNSRVLLSPLAILEQSLGFHVGSIPDYLPVSFVARARSQLAEIADDAEIPALLALLDATLASRLGLSLPLKPPQPLLDGAKPAQADCQPDEEALHGWPDTEVLAQRQDDGADDAWHGAWCPTLPLGI